MVRQDVKDLMTKISAREDPNLPEFAARVHTTLKDGRRFSKEYNYVRGHPENPFTQEELIDKFRNCVRYSAYNPGDLAIHSVIEALLNLDQVDDVVDAVLRPLTPEPTTVSPH